MPYRALQKYNPEAPYVVAKPTEWGRLYSVGEEFPKPQNAFELRRFRQIHDQRKISLLQTTQPAAASPVASQKKVTKNGRS